MLKGQRGAESTNVVFLRAKKVKVCVASQRSAFGTSLLFPPTFDTPTFAFGPPFFWKFTFRRSQLSGEPTDPSGLEPSAAFFRGRRPLNRSKTTPQYCQTNIAGKKKKQNRKKQHKSRDLALAPTPPPSEDRVRNPGNPERAEGALAAAHPGDVTFHSPNSPAMRGLPDPLSMLSGIRSVSWQH